MPQLSAKRDHYQPLIPPIKKSERIVGEYLDSLTMWDAAQEAHTFLTPSRILRGLAQGLIEHEDKRGRDL